MILIRGPLIASASHARAPCEVDVGLTLAGVGFNLWVRIGRHPALQFVARARSWQFHISTASGVYLWPTKRHHLPRWGFVR